MRYLFAPLAMAALFGCVDTNGDGEAKSAYVKKQLLACKMAGYPRFTAHDVEIFCMKTVGGSDVMVPAKEVMAKEDK